jgi:hypothetical protein
MQKRVFFLTQLKQNADRDAYERFLRDVDYPLTQELLPVSYYRATRIEGKLIGEGESPYQYIEVLDIEDYDAYTKAFENPSPQVADLIEQVFSHVDSKTALALMGQVVE